MNNFEKIKTLSIDDFALFLSMFAYTCGETEKRGVKRRRIYK